MKRTLLVLAFVAAAGPASAQTAQSPASDNANADTRMNTQMNGGNGSVGPRGADAAAAPANTTGPAATARKRIEMDGYKDVHGLAKGADGLWRGTAKRDSKTVEVTVDRAGRVAEQ